MDVYEAVMTRRAVRGFTAQPVPHDTVKRVLAAAAWAPSGSNLQPWRVYVVEGPELTALKARAVARVAAGDPWDPPQFEMYPAPTPAPYAERRSDFGRRRYSALGIDRDDWEARRRSAIGNWSCFGAPLALFCYIDRRMGPPQWADVGMYLQTVMLLLRAEGLSSCPQMAWSLTYATVGETVHPDDDLVLFCGLSVGYADPSVADARTGRAPLADTVSFIRDMSATRG